MIKNDRKPLKHESSTPLTNENRNGEQLNPNSLHEPDTLKLLQDARLRLTELEKQNDNLRASKTEAEATAKKYMELYDLAPSGNFTLSKECLILELNYTGAQMLRKNRSLLINKDFSSFISYDYRVAFTTFLMGVFEGNRSTCDVVLMPGPDVVTQVQLSGTIAENSNKCLISAIDITERLHSAELLAISETRYRRLFETAKDGILILNAESGMIVDVNPFLVDLLGYSRDQFLGKRIWEVGFLKDLLENKLNFVELQEKGYIRYEDMPLETAHGEKKDVEFVSNLYLVNNFKVIQCNIRDITERKKAAEVIKKYVKDLTYANETKDKFFSIIAHDLKSPFHGLLNLTEIMMSEGEKFTIHEFLESSKSLNELTKNLYQLLTNLLEWTQMQKGSMEYIPDALSVFSIVSQSISLMKQIAEQKGITIINDVDSGLKVIGDERMIHAVLRNLISNAIKFTNSGGIISIKTDKTENKLVEISVADNGVGITDEDARSLFKIEGKAKSLGTAGETGTGLGLILCKEFIEKNGGTIWVRSDEGKGSVFYFTIPEAPLLLY